MSVSPPNILISSYNARLYQVCKPCRCYLRVLVLAETFFVADFLTDDALVFLAALTARVFVFFFNADFLARAGFASVDNFANPLAACAAFPAVGLLSAADPMAVPSTPPMIAPSGPPTTAPTTAPVAPAATFSPMGELEFFFEAWMGEFFDFIINFLYGKMSRSNFTDAIH
jgi:hypothetical protein